MNEEGKLKAYIGEMKYILFVEKKKILYALPTKSWNNK